MVIHIMLVEQICFNWLDYKKMLFTSKVASYGCKEERVKDIKSFENILLKLNECNFFSKYSCKMLLTQTTYLRPQRLS